MSNQTSTAASQAKFDYKTAVGLPPTSNSAGMDAITSSENQHAGVITTWPAPTDIVDVINPLDCRAVESVANWPTLSDVARKYLGYTPTTRDVRLRWTIAKRLDHGQCEALNATVPMHFDFNAFRTMYANFYLTDTDRWSGAHVFVKGSHRRKPLRWTFGCSVRRESEIRKIYSPTDVIVVEGVAGSGFFEDPLCYHKPTAPADHDRLFLQVRFY